MGVPDRCHAVLLRCAEALLIDWRMAGVVTLAFVVLLGQTSFAQSDEYSGRHGDGHAQMHDVYKQWHPPLNPGTSCCDDSDCRPTRAFVDDEGYWRAWNGSLWLQVPQDRVLPPDFAGDGRSHLCEKEQFIYCFAPGEIRG
jgi:hypothetical protein